MIRKQNLRIYIAEGTKIQIHAQKNILNEIVAESFPNTGKSVTSQAHRWVIIISDTFRKEPLPETLVHKLRMLSRNNIKCSKTPTTKGGLIIKTSDFPVNNYQKTKS